MGRRLTTDTFPSLLAVELLLSKTSSRQITPIYETLAQNLPIHKPFIMANCSSGIQPPSRVLPQVGMQ
jgi:hypothetical protein